MCRCCGWTRTPVAQSAGHSGCPRLRRSWLLKARPHSRSPGPATVSIVFCSVLSRTAGTDMRPRVVVLGMMTKMPVGGVIWQTAQYLVGLHRLGCDVHYVEMHARTPSMLMARDDDDGAALAARFIDGVMRRFDLGG